MDQNLIAARTMAQAVQYDPQFNLPQHPHFPAELVTIPLVDALVIDGTDELQMFRGRATKVLLPRLLPLLDGTRTVQQLAEALPDIPIQAIYNAISLLYTRGVLEDNSVSPAIDREHCNPQTLAFFRRYVDVTRVNRSAQQAQARLQQKEVIVYTFGPNAQEMSNLLISSLRHAGVSHVESPSYELLSSIPLPEFSQNDSNKKFIVVFVEGEKDQEWLHALDDRCAAAGQPWLLATVYPDLHMFELGPYVEHGETVCYHCFARAKQEKSETTVTRTTGESSRIQARMALNFLSIEIIYLLSRIATAATGNGVMQYDLENWTTKRIRFPKLYGCIHCRPLQTAQSNATLSNNETISAPGWIDTALVYEDAVAFPSRHLLDPKTHQLHYRPDNIELTYEGKTYLNTKRINLPGMHDFPGLAGEALEHLSGNSHIKPTAPLDIPHLTTLLLLSAGIQAQSSDKRGKLQRWSSTGGNLGSVELYIVALRVQDLEPGIYFYQAFDHCLASLKYQNEIDEVTHFMQKIVPLTQQPDALIITTAAFHRVSHKYAAFGYRICNLDAGFALGQIHLAGSGSGLHTQTVPDWADDIIANEFGLEDLEEMVTAVVAVSGI